MKLNRWKGGNLHEKVEFDYKFKFPEIMEYFPFFYKQEKDFFEWEIEKQWIIDMNPYVENDSEVPDGNEIGWPSEGICTKHFMATSGSIIPHDDGMRKMTAEEYNECIDDRRQGYRWAAMDADRVPDIKECAEIEQRRSEFSYYACYECKKAKVQSEFSIQESIEHGIYEQNQRIMEDEPEQVYYLGWIPGRNSERGIICCNDCLSEKKGYRHEVELYFGDERFRKLDFR